MTDSISSVKPGAFGCVDPDFDVEIAEKEPVYGDINRFMRLTKSENERGLVLSVAAFSEDLLGRLLMAYMRGGKVASELVDGFNAPLGTFSSRIKAGLALGILSDDQYKDLEITRKLRNEFAHNWEGCSLSSQKLMALVENMTPSRINKPESTSSIDKFRESMTCVLVELSHLLNSISKGTQVLPSIAVHFSTEPIA